MDRLNHLFDDAVAKLHDLQILGFDIYPYLLFLNAGVVLSFALIFVFSALVTPIDTLAYAAIFGVMVLSYENVYTTAKERLIGTRERNFPLDMLVYTLPVGLVLAYLARLNIGAIATLAAMQMALSNGLTRFGCFSGGCCYGVDSAVGVRYPDDIFTEHDGLQDFSPGTNPESRVFPCQLVEMVAQLLLFTALLAYLLAGNPSSFALLIAYFCGYSVVRFLNDFTRQYTHRPTYGPFTEGQVISVFVFTVGATYLLL